MLNGILSYHETVGEVLVERGLVLLVVLPWLILLSGWAPAASRSSWLARWMFALLMIDRILLDYRFWLPFFTVLAGLLGSWQIWLSHRRLAVILLLSGLAAGGLGSNAIDIGLVKYLLVLVCLTAVFGLPSAISKVPLRQPGAHTWLVMNLAVATLVFGSLVNGVSRREYVPFVAVALVGYVLVAFSIWLEQKRGAGQKSRKIRSIRPLLAWTAAGLCLTWVVAEIYFRYVYDYSDANNALRVMSYWTQRHVRENRSGYRDREWPEPDHLPEGLRVLVLGDSFTYGSGIARLEDTLGQQLERELQKRATGAVNVFSIGVPGLNTPYETQLFTDHQPRHKPNVVVLQYHLNDIDEMSGRATVFPGWYEMWRPAMRSSDFAEFFCYHLYMAMSSRTASWRYLDSVEAYADPSALARQTECLGRLVRLVRQAGATPVAVVFPFLERPTDSGPQRVALDKALAIFESLRVRSVDVSRLARVNERKFHASPFDPHPSAELIAVVAPELAEMVLREAAVSQSAPSSNESSTATGVK